MLSQKEAPCAKPGGAGAPQGRFLGTQAGQVLRAIFVPVFQEAGILDFLSMDELWESLIPGIVRMPGNMGFPVCRATASDCI